MGKLIDLAGQTYGMLVVVSQAERRGGIICWNCECKCGNKVVVRRGNLQSGNTISCGCILATNLEGKRFGRWLVLHRAENRGKKVCWLCRCDCGKERRVSAWSLTSGESISCGCYNLELITTHGMTNTPEFRAWNSMKQRCNNPNDKNYHNYGGRGISICDSWLDSFENFYSDMGKRPDNHSIDRLDNDGNYCPENCKWVTMFEQNCNKRNNSEILGVSKRGEKQWKWEMSANGQRFCGSAKTKEAAILAYDDKSEELGRGRPHNTKRKYFVKE